MSPPRDGAVHASCPVFAPVMQPPDSPPPPPRSLRELLGMDDTRAPTAPAKPARAVKPAPPATPAPTGPAAPPARAVGRSGARRAPPRVPAADVPPAMPERDGGAADPPPPSGTSGAARSRPRTKPREHTPAFAIIDASNVAHAGEGSSARLANILAVREKLAAEGFEPIVVADAALRHQIDDTARYERLVEDGLVKQAPAGTDADYFILSFAKELNGTIVSNDQFRDGGSQFAEVRKRVIRYMVVAGEVVLERRVGRRS